MRNWRKMTWVLIAWVVLILIWMIASGSSADCANEAQREACEVGTGIGVALVALIGFFGFVFLALIWFMTRPKNRPCPRCGADVRKGQMECQACGYDFSSMGQQPSPTAGT